MTLKPFWILFVVKSSLVTSRFKLLINIPYWYLSLIFHVPIPSSFSFRPFYGVQHWMSFLSYSSTLIKLISCMIFISYDLSHFCSTWKPISIDENSLMRLCYFQIVLSSILRVFSIKYPSYILSLSFTCGNLCPIFPRGISRPKAGASQKEAKDSDKDTLNTSEMRKSDSTQSLAWDAILEQARQKALAPDAVQSVQQFLYLRVVVALFLCLDDAHHVLVSRKHSSGCSMTLLCHY